MASTAEQKHAALMDYIKSLNLNWTLRSCEFVRLREGYTLNQLRSALFESNGIMQADYERSAKILIAAGLVNQNTVSPDDYASILNRAADICEHVRGVIGVHVGILQYIIVDLMEAQNFFIGSAGAELLALHHSQGLQPDMVKQLMAVTLHSKAAQTEGLA